MASFTVTYQVTTYESETIHQKVDWICLEQSVELPRDVLASDIEKHIPGKPIHLKEIADNVFEVIIEWPLEIIGNDPTQFLNVLYGNISLKKGIKVTDADWESLSGILRGPGLGVESIRSIFALPERAMTCGVLKPLGSDVEALSGLAYSLASGGVDFIKDDHGIVNQSYAPFEERVEQVVKAIEKAEGETGHRTGYFPNITTSGSKAFDNYKRAYELGADGVLVIPHTMGYEVMHELAQSDIRLPIIAHPAFSGALVSGSSHGFSPSFLYGGLFRAFGADCVVYPNTGGRFSFTPEECVRINEHARREVAGFKKAFPMPGGGMDRDTISTWAQKYGSDTIFLIGASLFQHPLGVTEAVKELQTSLKN